MSAFTNSIERAKEKLAEARFFLAKLQKEKGRDDTEVFGYYTSAFLSAAVSVVFVLQDRQIGDHKWLKNWRKKLPLEEEEFLGQIEGQRTSEVHKLGPEISTPQRRAVPELDPSVQIFTTPVALWDEEEIKRLHKENQERGLPPGCQVWTYIYEHFFLIRGIPTEIISSCQRYLSLLERLIQEFEAAQSSPEQLRNV